MLESIIKSVWTQYSIAGMLVLLLFFIIKWGMKREEVLSEQAIYREKQSVEREQILTKIVKDQDIAHEFQRKEHEIMIEDLKEITKTLGRINGYKG